MYLFWKNSSLILLFLLCSSKVTAQSGDTISYTRFGIVSGLTVAGVAAGYMMQKDMWWKGEKRSFHFEWDKDWKYALGADKVGHTFTPYLLSRTYQDIFTWCNLSEKEAAWYASGFALSYQTFIEIRDGYLAEWGFSWGDFGADVLGAALPVAQVYYPSLQQLHLKISFYPSQRFKDGSNRYIVDDYESTFHWLVIDPQAFLPETVTRNIPRWIKLAVGHNVQQLDSPQGGTHHIYLSLDWNLEAIQTSSPLLRSVLKFFNHYHLPAPAISVYPKFAGFLVKF